MGNSGYNPYGRGVTGTSLDAHQWPWRQGWPAAGWWRSNNCPLLGWIFAIRLYRLSVKKKQWYFSRSKLGVCGWCLFSLQELRLIHSLSYYFRTGFVHPRCLAEYLNHQQYVMHGRWAASPCGTSSLHTVWVVPWLKREEWWCGFFGFVVGGGEWWVKLVRWQNKS